MTAQIPDLFRHRGRAYSLAGISEGRLFEPSQLSLEPAATCTACWRGYQAVYAIVDLRLVLDTLHVNLHAVGTGYQRREGPQINGVSPKGPSGEYDFFNNHCLGISYPIEYTGGLLLADGFIKELYVHMGFHPAWKYTNVIELVFEKGVLQKEFDRSERMAEVRRQVVKSRQDSRPDAMSTLEEVRDFVERSFDRTYQM